jgi:hypothetical protein
MHISQSVAWLIAEVERISALKVIYISIDDSISEKDKDIRHLEAFVEQTISNMMLAVFFAMRILVSPSTASAIFEDDGEVNIV